MPSTIAAPAAATLPLTPTTVVLHTVPTGARHIVEVILTNIDNVAAAAANVWWRDASAANALYLLASSVNVAAKDVVVLPRKTLEAGDAIVASASAAGDITAHVNVLMEIT